MPVRYWHRLGAYFLSVAMFRVLKVKLCEGVELPFTPATAFGAIGSPSGLKFLVEIASRDVYSDFEINEGAGTNVLYDVGANCGFFSIIRCRQDAGLHAYCFEPHPTTFRILERNIRLNGLEGRVVPVNVAVGNDVGVIAISMSESSSMASVMDPSGQGEDCRKQEVAIVSLDEFSRERGLPNAIKIDVEGYEEQVLRGAPHVLAAAKTIVVEVHSPELENKCRTILEASGFRVVQKGPLLFSAGRSVIPFGN